MGQPRADPSPNLTITHTPGSWVWVSPSVWLLVCFHYFFPCCTVMLSSILSLGFDFFGVARKGRKTWCAWQSE